MGLGKALMELMTAAYLYKAGKISRLLVVAPKGCYAVWFDNEVPKHLSENLPYKLAYWSSYSNKEDKKQLASLESPGEALRILVVNVEACNSERTVDFMVDFMKKQATMLVVDESTVLKNPQAKRTKIMINVGKFAKYRRICTGNPIPNGAIDLWSQTEFLQKNLMGFTNFYAFRNRFAVLQDQRFGNQSFKRIVGYRDLDALRRMMDKFSFICKKEDCLDLPKKVYQTVDVQMGPRQTEAYNKMLNDAFIALSDGSSVTAQMVMTQLVRLHQIACGFMKPDHMPEVPFGEPNDRVETLLSLLEQAPGKCIVWATYRYNVRQLVDAIGKKFGEESVVDFYGATSADDRKYAKQAFQDPDSPVKYIVSNPASGRFGNTLTQGTTVIYFSNSYDLEFREQSEDRAHRIGQVGAIHVPGEDPSVLYVDLVAKGTVDERIVKVLKAKKKLTDDVVQSNWRWILGSQVA
jgi:SNF2 family DNA or RNA helicase